MTIAEKLTRIAENESKVYDAGWQDGFANGRAEGKAEGIDEGRQAEHDAFWDGFQDKGSRTVYDYLGYKNYSVGQWFYPKYDICPTSAYGMFREARVDPDDRAATLDLAERLDECGVKLDLSQCTNVWYLFYQALFSHLPELDLSSAGSTANKLLFSGYVETIDKLILPSDQEFGDTFRYCVGLKNIVIGSVFDQSVSVKDSKKLTRASIESIVGALSDTASGQTLTLAGAAVAKAFETYEGAGDGAANWNWTNLVDTKPNWTITLIW